MAKTKLANMIIPENFNAYVSEKAVEKNAFFRSGVLVDNPQLRELLSMGGKTIHMPFVKPLSGDSQIPTEDGDLSINDIETSEDEARRQFRVQVFGENQLASVLSGDNVMDRIAEGFGDYWATEYNKILLATCKGVFSSLTGHVHDISLLEGVSAVFNVDSAIDAKFLLGDAHDKLGAVAVHSKVYALMLKQDQIETVKNSEGTGSIKIYKPLQCEIIVDDAVPFDSSSKIASMYMFGKGAFGFVEDLTGIVGTEIYRDALKGLGDNALINRKQFVLHPLGVAWKEPEGERISPTNQELETKANWSKKYEDKNIPLAEFKFKVEVAA
ncbi:major capsid protein [Paraclostridium dentum]|uniref:major capsid protein n=1 Tax=Paraclostridium dentum TaxID=2662455 RepID=UPI00051D97CA|nr:major capsid protein [Paraclostridium dentum]KGJ49706.1 hypothetical protein KD33_07040 [Clostridium sp. NCR]